jgi:hypothetical protein
MPHIPAAMVALARKDLILPPNTFSVHSNHGELIMNKKLTHFVMAVFVGILTCSVEGQFRCETQGEIPFGGGVVQPLSSTPGYSLLEPSPRQHLDIDEQIQGARSAPVPGVGLMQTWGF